MKKYQFSVINRYFQIKVSNWLFLNINILYPNSNLNYNCPIFFRRKVKFMNLMTGF